MSFEDDVWQIFKAEETLKGLDSKLDEFAEVWQELHDFHKEVRGKYQALDFFASSEDFFCNPKVETGKPRYHFGRGSTRPRCWKLKIGDLEKILPF